MSATIPEELYEVVDCELVFEYGMAEGIKNNYIVDYNVWLPQVVKKEDGNTIEIDIPEGFDKSEICSKVLFLVTGMLQTGSKRCIVYLSSKEECKLFNELFAKVCKEYHGLSSYTETIDCDVKQEKRRTILDEFQTDKDDLSSLHIISSVRILDEAVDVPRCDSEFIGYVGVNADDKRAIQRLQRGGRLDSMNPSKKNNLFIWCNEYSKILNMLSLLKESDPEFHTKLRVIDGSYDKVSMKESIDNNKVQVGELRNYVMIACLSADDIWEEKRLKVIKYLEINNAKFPSTLSSDKYEKTIGLWVKNQKRNYKKNILSEKRIKLLEQLNDWIWETPRKSFEYYYNILIEFYNINKRLPKKKRDRTNNDEYELGWWTSRIRSKYKKGKLNEDYSILLNKLSFWKWILQKNTFEDNLQLWIKFIKDNKKHPSFSSRNEYEKKIAAWAGQQRGKFRRGILNIKYIKLLNKVNEWVWEFDDFTEKFNKMKEYFTINKKLCSQHSNDDNIKKIGIWIQNMRKAYKGGNMSEERIVLFNSLDYWSWDDSNNTFEDNLQLWKNYIDTYKKDPLGNSTDINEKSIASWVSRIRYYYKNNSNSLKKEHIELLNNNPNWKWKVRVR